MRVAYEKSQFFKDSVEYLGFVGYGAKSDPENVKAIREYPEPTTVLAHSWA